MRVLGLIGGDIFHGALEPDQLFGARLLLGQDSYRGALGGACTCAAQARIPAA